MNMLNGESGLEPARRWITAVVDRIEDGGLAVLALMMELREEQRGEPREREETEEETEMVVPLDALPKGVREGTWLKIRLLDGVIVESRIDADATRAAAERIAAKLERLRLRR